ncbi:MAG: aspartate aminotransferase family protein [Dehalococcoidia bacterium]|mgnify:FL=1|nr:aspartate aminotransferase family protein [Dehalococcoidia bacterium]MQG09193.1 aspartate aminotransferase family protein [SAR202 cluster bacterium]|tara:strand:+ start:3235 stop:4431 length:1197 start_codon:yes stop_codon:yes gene_type:complete
MLSSKEYKELEKKYYMQVVNRMPPVLVSGQGTEVFDNEGNSYLDFTAGWAVLNVGHNHPKVTKAIQDQSSKILQMSNLFYTTPQLPLAKILIENSDLDRVFFCNSGAEANEGACKVARKWGKKKLNGAFEIITTLNSFHGRTQAMMAATGQPHYQNNWKPLMPGFVNVEYNNLEAIKSAYDKDKTCAVLLEPVQGEGGVNIPSENYLLDVMKFCHEKNILFMLDEVQTGMGRLGTFFGYQKYSKVEPDVMSLAKALGAGTPLGAFLTKEFCSVLEPGDHGSTFGGNALTTAAGGAAAQVLLDEKLPEMANSNGNYFMEKLKSLMNEFSFITEVRGKGLLIGLEMSKDISPEIVSRCLDKGLLINAVRPNMIRFMPPLNVTKNQIDKSVSILISVLKEM